MHKYAIAVVLIGLLIFSGNTILAGSSSTDVTPCSSSATLAGETRFPCYVNVLMGYEIVSQTETFGVFGWVKAPVRWFAALYKATTYEPAAFQGGFEILRWIFLLPIYIAVAFGILSTFWLVFRPSQ